MRDSDSALSQLRRDILAMAEHSAHVAVALSCVDMLAALYWGVMDAADSFVLSKGHGAMALYAVLARAGRLDPELLATYGQDHSPLPEHPPAGKFDSIEFASGSLGHGLAAAAGMAKARKLQCDPSRVFVLLGDGECDEGEVWEAASAARAMRLDNLTALVDCNGLQACCSCADVSEGRDLAACWRAVGWDVIELDGHDFDTLQTVLQGPTRQGVPRVLLCQTVKGKGVPFMEGNLEWHYRPVRGEELAAALRSLDNA